MVAKNPYFLSLKFLVILWYIYVSQIMCCFNNYSGVIIVECMYIQVDWRAEIEENLAKIRQEGLSPPQAHTELVQQRAEELKLVI